MWILYPQKSLLSPVFFRENNFSIYLPFQLVNCMIRYLSYVLMTHQRYSKVSPFTTLFRPNTMR